MKGYKYTSRTGKAHAGYQWTLPKGRKPGKEHFISRRDRRYADLCSPGFFHFYEHPLLAYIFRSLHTSFDRPVLWEVEANERIVRNYDKAGARRLRILRKMPPQSDRDMRKRVRRLCVLIFIRSLASGRPWWGELIKTLRRWLRDGGTLRLPREFHWGDIGRVREPDPIWAARAFLVRLKGSERRDLLSLCDKAWKLPAKTAKRRK